MENKMTNRQKVKRKERDYKGLEEERRSDNRMIEKQEKE